MVPCVLLCVSRPQGSHQLPVSHCRVRWGKTVPQVLRAAPGHATNTWGTLQLRLRESHSRYGSSRQVWSFENAPQFGWDQNWPTPWRLIQIGLELLERSGAYRPMDDRPVVNSSLAPRNGHECSRCAPLSHPPTDHHHNHRHSASSSSALFIPPS